jgi:hypothetical protein
MVVLNDTFDTIPIARDAVNQWLLNPELSYHVLKSKESIVYEIDCKARSQGCTFTVTVWNTRGSGPTARLLQSYNLTFAFRIRITIIRQATPLNFSRNTIVPL